ncbi:ABC transporter ATP-binding protein [Paenibacillus hubeiensis]|uniref:ABC transporter ATP-binding protein n=1 Tax=Paenibacillus hubeiensis TaxID=3077330 RepID=UPI0031BA9E15
MNRTAAYNDAKRLISLRQVGKRLDGSQVLKDIDLEVHEGQCIVLVGRNGSGKSTLLRVIAGLLNPDQGTMHCKREVPVRYAPDRLVRLPFTSWEYLWQMGRIQGIRPGALRKIIHEQSDRLGLEGALDQKMSSLSKGTLQKVNLLQALLAGPRGLLLLDVPLSGLDAAAQEAVISIARQWKDAGASIITACHEPLFIERLADQVDVLQAGDIIRRWERADFILPEAPLVYIHSLLPHPVQSQLFEGPIRLAGQEGVLHVRPETGGGASDGRWVWKVTRHASDRIIAMLIDAGGSIESVQQERQQLNMERLIKGEHPAAMDDDNESCNASGVHAASPMDGGCR